MSPHGFEEATLPPDVVRLFADLPAAHQRAVVARSWGAATAQGTRRRQNEDVWGHRSGHTFAVADGMGGRPGGAMAASVAVAALLDELENNAAPDWPVLVGNVNEAVRSVAWSEGHERSGAAISALHLDRHRATLLFLGDVRVYRLRSGQVELLTIDHNVREQLARTNIDPTRLSLRAGELDALTGFLGDPGSADEFGIRTLSVVTDDRLVVCSDGVHRRAGGTVWRQVAAQGDQDAADLLVQAARDAGGTDDATAMVITLGLSHPPDEQDRESR